MSLVEQEVIAEKRVARLTLNYPERRNALSLEMLSELAERLKALALADEINVIILAGTGPAFSSGHDLRQILHQPIEAVETLFQSCRDVMATLHRMPQIIIAQVAGIATAAGCQLVAASDLAVAAESARFATPGVRIGYFCGSPSVQVSRNLPLKIAAELLFTGEYLSAADAWRYGFVNRVVPDDRLDTEVMALAEAITRWSHTVLEAGKKLLYAQREMTEDGAAAYAAEFMVRQSYTADAIEGISAFFDKRPPRWNDSRTSPA